MTWKTIDRPGYFGLSRNEIQGGFDRQYGQNNWRIAWQWGDLTIQKSEALQIYEDGYYEYFGNKPALLEWLVSEFSNVFDTSPSNVEAEFSYEIQETPSNHLHDVAVRRAVLRRGKWFEGKDLLEIRGAKPIGKVLNPCMIPFHIPEMIYQGQTKYKGEPRDFKQNPPWWLTLGVKNSVEEFYQQNKLLQVKI